VVAFRELQVAYQVLQVAFQEGQVAFQEDLLVASLEGLADRGASQAAPRLLLAVASPAAALVASRPADQVLHPACPASRASQLDRVHHLGQAAMASQVVQCLVSYLQRRHHLLENLASRLVLRHRCQEIPA